jgi:hypothetical protein
VPRTQRSRRPRMGALPPRYSFVLNPYPVSDSFDALGVKQGPSEWLHGPFLPIRRIRPRRATRYTIGFRGMHTTRKIQVKNGRLVLDEPTDLSDGAEVEILVIDDELTSEERAELHASLDRALEDSDAGRGIEAWEYLERYRAGRESAGRPSQNDKLSRTTASRGS